MRLISIGHPNILVNPDQISCIEQEMVGITSITYIYIGDKKLILGVPLKDFWLSLGIDDMKSGGQHFAG